MEVLNNLGDVALDGELAVKREGFDTQNLVRMTYSTKVRLNMTGN